MPAWWFLKWSWTSALPGKLLEMQVPRPHPGPQSLGLGPGLHCHEASREWHGMPKFKDHSSGPSMGPRFPQASASNWTGS